MRKYKVLGLLLQRLHLRPSLRHSKFTSDTKQKLQKSNPRKTRFRTEHAPKNLDNLGELLIQNFRILNSFYAENLSQYRNSSVASIAIAVLGFIVIITGILIALIGDQVTLGAVSSAAGIVGEGAAVLFFQQNRPSNNKWNHHCRSWYLLNI